MGRRIVWAISRPAQDTRESDSLVGALLDVADEIAKLRRTVAAVGLGAAEPDADAVLREMLEAE